ncbi:MAG: flagellin [candidate division Zixibacteria bacterium]|nr:flagellin [candidate division Zixibacteria bacterium]
MIGFSINTNIGASDLSQSITRNYQELMRIMERLSSGLKINRASDDPAGLVISEQLRSQIASLNQEIENTSALINKYQTGSSTVSILRSQLTDLRATAVAAANEGGNDESTQAAYATSASNLVQSYNQILSTAEYNGTNLLDGSTGSLAEVSNLEGVDLSSAEAAEQSIAVIDEAITSLDGVQMDLAATQKNELESNRASLENTAQNLTAAESLIRDADFVMEYSNMISQQISIQASLAMMAHSSVTSEAVLNLLGS